MNLVLDAWVQFHRTDIGKEVELAPVENYLSITCQLGLGIWLARLGENRFSVNFMSDCAEQDRVGRFALFKRAVWPFGFVFSVVVTTTGNLFDTEINLKELAGRAQNAQGRRQDLRPDAITGQRYDGIGLFRHCYFCE